MPKKVSGKIGNSKLAYYCDAGEVVTNRVSFGVTRKVNTKTKKLMKKKKRCVGTSVAGKEIELQCDPCNQKQGCIKQGGEEALEEVVVFCEDYVEKRCTKCESK